MTIDSFSKRPQLRSRVRAFHSLSRGAAGSRAISQMLRQSDVDAGRWLARRLMWECGLTSRQPIKHHYRVNEDKNPPLPNLLNREFNPAAPNRVWCGDIIGVTSLATDKIFYVLYTEECDAIAH